MRGLFFFLTLIFLISLAGTEAGIYRENKVNTMAADALALCITRASAAMVLTVRYTGFVFYEGIQSPVPFHCGGMM